MYREHHHPPATPVRFERAVAADCAPIRLRRDAPPLPAEGWCRPRRRDVAMLWRIAGLRGGGRPGWFACALANPPVITCDHDPLVTVSLTRSPRRWAKVVALAAALTIVAAGAEAVTSLPAAVGAPVLAVAAAAAWFVAAPSLVTWSTPAGHVRVHDVVARPLGTGRGEVALTRLVASIEAPLSLTVREPKVRRIYERLGFTAGPERGDGSVHMTRPGSIEPVGTGSPWAVGLVVAATAGTSGVIGAGLSLAVSVLAVAALMVAVATAAIDLHERRLPNLGVAAVAGAAVATVAVGGSVVGAAASVAVAVGSIVAIRRWSHRVGFGDIKFSAACCAAVGAVALPAGILAAAFGFIVAGATAPRGRRGGVRALGPCLVIGMAMALVSLPALPTGGRP